MKSLIRICNLNTPSDRNVVTEIITNKEGIIACEISLSKKEIAVIYDGLTISLDEILNSIESAGYMII